MSINISTTPTNGGCRVAVSGEVDVSNASALRDALDEQLSSGEGALAIDLADVPYIDSTGIGVLVGAAHRAEEHARALPLPGVGAGLPVPGAQQSRFRYARTPRETVGIRSTLEETNRVWHWRVRARSHPALRVPHLWA